MIKKNVGTSGSVAALKCSESGEWTPSVVLKALLKQGLLKSVFGRMWLLFVLYGMTCIDETQERIPPAALVSTQN